MRTSFVFFIAALLLVTVLGVLPLWHAFGYPAFGVDDANIFFVYAENLANGHGFVYNVGGERVEGVTSLLWVGFCAIAFGNCPRPELALLVLNVVLVALTLTAAARFILSLDSGGDGNGKRWYSPWMAIYAVLFLTNHGYLTWATFTLMDSGVWSVLLVLTSFVVLQSRPDARRVTLQLLPLVILLLLARPESLLWVPVFIFVAGMRIWNCRKLSGAIKASALPVATYAIAVSVLTIWRIRYFGYPLPNTYYAKVDPSVFYNLLYGGKYIAQYLASDSVAFAATVAAALSLVHLAVSIAKRRPVERELYLMPIVATGLVAPIITGGDHFGSFRLFQNAFPLLLLSFVVFGKGVVPKYVTVKALNPSARRVARWCSYGVGVLYILRSLLDAGGFPEASKMAHEFTIAESGRVRGTLAREVFGELGALPSVGVSAAGGIKLSYPGNVIDLLGLNNSIVAHSARNRRGLKNHAGFNKAAFFRLHPDVVHLDVVRNADWRFEQGDLRNSYKNRIFRGLYDDPQFLDEYSFARINDSGVDEEWALTAWISRPVLRELSECKDVSVTVYEYGPVESVR